MMRNWIRKYGNEHSNCPKMTGHSLPTRVIEVGTESTAPRLVISDGQFGEWVALGHCWEKFFRSEQNVAHLKSVCTELPFPRLPATFRDAKLLTRGLGIPFLWIDVLCIIQDSRDDWLVESAKMDQVYKNAVVTIAAEAALESVAGIIGASESTRWIQSTPIKVPCVVDSTYPTRDEGSFVHTFENLTLLSCDKAHESSPYMHRQHLYRGFTEKHRAIPEEGRSRKTRLSLEKWCTPGYFVHWDWSPAWGSWKSRYNYGTDSWAHSTGAGSRVSTSWKSIDCRGICEEVVWSKRTVTIT